MESNKLERPFRNTGLDAIGSTPWGTHFCNFYHSKHDLIQILVPYFKAGLESNEFCLWITSGPVSVDDAITSLRDHIPLFDQYLASDAIEILSYEDWYLKNGVFDPKRVTDAWHEKLDHALANGYEGMRVNGNAWVDRNLWKEFIDYERELNKSIADKRMIVMCTYPLDKCNGSDVLDVVHIHEMTTSMRDGKLEVVQKPERKRSKADKLKEEELTHVLEEVKVSAERFSKLFHFNPVLPMVLSELRDGTYIEVNTSFTELFGFTTNDVIGKTVMDLDLWVDRTQRDSFVAKVREGGIVKNAEIQLKTKQGKILDTRVSMIAIPMNGGPKVLSMVLDCTEQKAAEKLLYESEKNLDTLINSSPGEIWLASPSLKLVKANNAFFTSLKNITGAEITEGDQLVAPGFPEERKEVWKGLYRRVLEGENVVHLDRRLDADGSELFFEVRLNPVRSDDGFIIGIGCFSNDITELIQFRKSLELKVALRTQELQKALEKEKELRAWKARFASMVSHEFRIPLTTIKNTANYIRRYRKTLAPKSIGTRIEVVLEQVDLMARMMGDLLVLGRADEDKITVTRREVEIRSFFEALKNGIQKSDHNSHDIACQFDFEEMYIDADDDLLRNIFVNLISNAIKFSPGSSRVGVDVKKLKENLRIDISDEGIGINEEDLAKIFDPFQRGKNTNGIQGTGLGLSIVKKAVDLMHGSIEVASKPGKGSVFTVTIPVK